MYNSAMRSRVFENDKYKGHPCPVTEKGVEEA